jgi:tetratricopeptide (TPR) repeat protein
MATGSFCLYIFGRLHGVTRDRLRRAVDASGGRLARRPSARVTLVALGCRSAAAALREGTVVELPSGLPRSVEVISELQVKRRLGLAPPETQIQGQFSAADLARATGLSPEAVLSLHLYDVLGGVGGRYGFRDLRAAREVKRLLDRDYTLGEIVEAATALRHFGRGLFDTSLSDAPWGETLQHSPGRLARLDGQYLLPLDETFQSADELFEQAEEREQAGDLAGAERLYHRAGAADRADPVIPFNLGNVLDAMGRTLEAGVAYRQAIGRDPSFAEAWMNLAALHERAHQFAETEHCLRKAVEARPDYPEAVFSLAALLTQRHKYREALPLWDRFVGLGPDAIDVARARRERMLCRLAAGDQPAWAAASHSAERPPLEDR